MDIENEELKKRIITTEKTVETIQLFFDYPHTWTRKLYTGEDLYR